jgi:aspartate-semialdehyde dehydrogenase
VYHYVTSPTGTDRLPSEATLPIVVVVASADFAPTTPISTTSDQQVNVGALRKQKSRNNIALHQEQTKKKANAAHNFIPHSPSKRTQEKRKVAKMCKIHERGQKLLRDAADDEDKVWAQEQQRVNRGTISTQNVSIAACTTKLAQLLGHEDFLIQKNHKKKLADTVPVKGICLHGLPIVP